MDMTEERISEVEDVDRNFSNDQAKGKTMGKKRNRMAKTCEIITKSIKYS